MANDEQNKAIISISTFAFSRELVYQAWANPSYLQQWWGPEGFTNTIHQHDLQAGGKWSFVMHGPDGRDYPNECIFIEVVPNEFLSWDHLPLPKFQVNTIFEDEGIDQTKVIFKMIFDTEKEADTLRDFIIEKNEENFVKLEVVLQKMKTENS